MYQANQEYDRIETTVDEKLKWLMITYNDINYYKLEYRDVYVSFDQGILKYQGTDKDGKKIIGAFNKWTSYSVTESANTYTKKSVEYVKKNDPGIRYLDKLTGGSVGSN